MGQQPGRTETTHLRCVLFCSVIDTLAVRWRPMYSPFNPLPATLLLTVPEVAQHLRVSKRTVHRLIASRSLPVLRVGRSIRIRRDDLHAFLDAESATSDNSLRTGPGVRNQKGNVCHTVAKTAPFGGRLTPTQADKELDALLEPQTERRPKHSKPNGSSNHFGPCNGAKSPVDHSPS